MSKTTTTDVRIVRVERVGGSRNGNPTYALHTSTGEVYRTATDAQCGYSATNYAPHYGQAARSVTLTLTRAGRVVGIVDGPEISEADQMLDRLRAIFPQGSTVATVVRHVSQSGMQRAIQVLAIDAARGEIDDVSWMISRAGLFKNHARQPGLKVDGVGMDMSFHVVYSLASRLYGDGYALNHRSI